jgi:hypothetical protein
MRSRTGGRVVEGTGLENRRTRKGIASSNLALSACPGLVDERAGAAVAGASALTVCD